MHPSFVGASARIRTPGWPGSASVRPVRLIRLAGRWVQISMLLALAYCVVGCGSKSSTTDNATPPQWISQHNPHARIAVVFVHGIFGDTLGTWKGSGASFFQLLQSDAAIGPKVDIYAFGFSSSMFGAGSFGIDEAATTLYGRLDSAGILAYPDVVFIDHSMGGLVTMHMLADHPLLIPQVSDLIFFSVPQSGAEITNIAQYVMKNEALRNMLPGDSNAYIRTLNDRWKALAVRPRVHCAYEKLNTGPVKVVDWESSTRFCDGPAQAITADHISIVKPDGAQSLAMMVVQLALKPLIPKTFEPVLEVPDFAMAGGSAVVEIADPTGKKDFRVRNTGTGVLTYSLDQWPNDLYVWPGSAEYLLPGGGSGVVQVALRYGASAVDYHFVFHSNASAPIPVTVHVKDLTLVKSRQAKLAADVLNALSNALKDPARSVAFSDPSPEKAREELVNVVGDTIARQDPTLSDVARWIATAEILTAGNWPALGTLALRRAEALEPSVIKVPPVQRLAAEMAGLSGQSAKSVEPLRPDELTDWASNNTTLFTSATAIGQATDVSAQLVRFAAFKNAGVSLLGDIARAKGQSAVALGHYREVAVQDKSPVNELRLRAIGVNAKDPIG